MLFEFVVWFCLGFYFWEMGMLEKVVVWLKEYGEYGDLMWVLVVVYEIELVSEVV